MKKIISIAFFTLLSSVLVGCGDSNNNNEFVNFVKDALKEKKEHISIYDFNDNKYYIYHDFIMNNENEINDIFSSSALKNCSKTKEEVNKIVSSDDDITFTCIQSSGNFPDEKVKFQIIGKEKSYNQNFIDSDINYLMNFNNNTRKTKQFGQFPISEKDNIIKGLKSACNISKEKEIYNNCGYPNSIVKIIGL